jgi:hypothetical protein
MTVYLCLASGSFDNGDIWNTTLHVEKIGGSTAGAAAAWHTAFGILWNGNAAPADDIKQFLFTGTTCDFTLVNELSPLTGKNVSQVVTGETLAGTSTADQMPQETSIVISKRTALPTKAGRGRMYIPGTTVDAQGSIGELGSGVADVVSLAAEHMMQSLNTATYQCVVWHRDSLSTTNIIGLDVASLFRVQRRRQNKLTLTRSRRTL